MHLRLRPGDIVDIVAPGFRCSDEDLGKAVAFLNAWDLQARVPADLFAPDLLCASSDERRCAHLRAALSASDSRAVWCVRAGYGAIRFVEQLYADAPPPTAKLFIGYSDVTTLHHLLNHHWHWPSLHAPLLDRLGQGTARQEELVELRDALFGNLTQIVFANLVPLNAAARGHGCITGTVTGGNLTVLQTMLGTPWQHAHDGILFLEDIGERGYRIDRTLQHLRLAGAFQHLRAIVFGNFHGGREADGTTLVPAVLERFATEQRFPVFAGMSAGHGEYQRPVPFNTRAELRGGSEGELRIEVM
jgi:muramoyltetrapeptide carboxypeptidase